MYKETNLDFITRSGIPTFYYKSEEDSLSDIMKDGYFGGNIFRYKDVIVLAVGKDNAVAYLKLEANDKTGNLVVVKKLPWMNADEANANDAVDVNAAVQAGLGDTVAEINKQTEAAIDKAVKAAESANGKATGKAIADAVKIATDDIKKSLTAVAENVVNEALKSVNERIDGLVNGDDAEPDLVDQ